MTKTNLFVIDTNILISAFILPYSPARNALNKARKDKRSLTYPYLEGEDIDQCLNYAAYLAEEQLFTI